MKEKETRISNWKTWRWPIGAAILLSWISLFRSTLGQATDFEVFWRVGQALRHHVPFYDPSQSAGMVFKYPPWIALLFLPLGFLDFITAKGVWALVELFSLAMMFRFLRRDFRVSEQALLLVFPLFWGIWVIHFLDGQIILPVLAAFLYFVARPGLNPAARGFAPVLMTIKIFTVFPLLAVWERFWNRRSMYSIVMLTTALAVGTALLSFDGHFLETIHQWLGAAASGAKFLNSGQTRGGKNQSLVSYVCRLANVPAEDAHTEVILSVCFYIAAWSVMRWRRRQVDERDYVFCFLALTAPLHPLPWHHLYVWTFPLAVARFDRDARRPVYWIAMFLLCLSSARALPFGGVGEWLEWNVGRAWGALLLTGQCLFGRVKKGENA